MTDDSMGAGGNRTAAATAARMKTSEEKAAAKLRSRGWVCVSPDEARRFFRAGKWTIKVVGDGE